MKKFQRFCTLFLLMIGLCSFALHAQSYAGLWRQVEQAQKKSLPQTVVKLTEKIYRKAELEKNAPQMLKAYICREAYQERLTPDSLYTNLKKLESWVESEKNLVNKAILHSLLAREYSDYMLGKPFGIESVLNQRTCIPQSFQRAFFAGHLILFVTNHTLLVFSFQIKKFYILVATIRRYDIA